RPDTITPMRAGFVRALSHIALCVVLSPFLGYLGLALAATLALYLKLGVLAWSARRLLTAGERRRTLRRVAQAAAACALSPAALYPLARVWRPAGLDRLAALEVAIGGLLYLAAYLGALWLIARRQVFAHAGLLRRALFRPPVRARLPLPVAAAAAAARAAAEG